MDFWRPQIGRVIETWRRFEDELRLGIVPISQNVATVQGDVLVVGICHVVVVIMPEHPAVMVSFRSASNRRHAYGSAPVAFNTGFVKVEDEFEL